MAVPVWATNDVPTATDFNVWLTNVISATKSANESVTSSTVLQNDDALVVPVAANSTYDFRCQMRFDGATTGDIKWQWTLPASGLLTYTALFESAAGTTASISQLDNSVSSTASAFGAGVVEAVEMHGLLIIAGTAGNVQLQWAQVTSDATATRVLSRSFIFLTRIV